MKQWQLGAVAALFSGSLMAAPLPVVASFSVLGDVVHQIGGNRVSVQTIVGPDQDAHTYQLTPADVRKIRTAKLVVFNGLGLEKAAEVRAAQQAKVPVAYASSGIKAAKAEEEEHDHGHEGHDHGEFDPHVWNDPVLMQTYVRNVANALIKVDPAGKAYYQQRLGSYENTLKSLHAYAQKSFAAIPVAKRKVLTSHDAFGYMGRRYQIQFIAPQGVSTEAEPSAKDVASIIRQVKQQGIKAIFFENIKNPRVVQQIARETGTAIKGELYSDALSKNAQANTYANMFRHNVAQLSRAMK
ncbi:metal ABC transporter solute-binding protein, Zn/Mn family [Snodgrassella sp. CFCC 13594]|uniref:metal ABC transporter solute-binding protein, Zn/Mn family n=1 Tax=Snodgrassella sp. CFCC 13594 TaxID=1775559 RepID=UPI000833E4E5|nr:zinc ABC transporter substrate-binding protein [Snodgrassella sp. CFCC 13594]